MREIFLVREFENLNKFPIWEATPIDGPRKLVDIDKVGPCLPL